jgi:prepilin-type N-terminal cleavage/methylation domain-containing protein
MKRFMKRMHRGEGGFTLIELLIVIAILGIIAAIVVPNVSGFMTSGQLNAANTEVQNVKTAAVGYLAENGDWPGSSDELDPYLEGTHTALKATYTFDHNTITGATATASGWPTTITWDADSQTWIRA